jgi:hypothetical protein
VAAFLLEVHRLADIVEQASPFGQVLIEAEFSGHDAGEIGDFDRMVEGVLAIGSAILQFARDSRRVLC